MRAGELAVDVLRVLVPVLHDGGQVVAAHGAGRGHAVDEPVHGLARAVEVQHPLAAVHAVGVVAHHALVALGHFLDGALVALLLRQLRVHGVDGAAAPDDVVHALEHDHVRAVLGGCERAAQAGEPSADDHDVGVHCLLDVALGDGIGRRLEVVGAARGLAIGGRRARLALLRLCGTAGERPHARDGGGSHGARGECALEEAAAVHARLLVLHVKPLPSGGTRPARPLPARRPPHRALPAP